MVNKLPALPLRTAKINGTRLALVNASGGLVTYLDCPQERGDAIAHACNAYPRLVEALRAAYALPFAPSNNGEQWDEGYKRGWDSALDQVFRAANTLLRELGEEPSADDIREDAQRAARSFSARREPK